MGADLNNIIKTQKLSDDHVQFLVYQIVRGMKYVHSAGIIHRWDGPSSEDGNIKLFFSFNSCHGMTNHAPVQL